MTADTNPYASPTITEKPPISGRSFWRTPGRVARVALHGCLIGGAIGGVSGGAGAAILGTVYVVASGGKLAMEIIGGGAMLGAVNGAMLGSSLGCLAGIVVVFLKRPRRRSIAFLTAVIGGVGGALVGALGGGILGSPGSQAAWIPIGIIIGAMAGSAGGMALGYAMASLNRFCFEPSERHG